MDHNSHSQATDTKSDDEERFVAVRPSHDTGTKDAEDGQTESLG